MPDASLLTSLFPEEVVTRALVRDVELPDGAGPMALITLDNGLDHTRPSTFGPAGLLALGVAAASGTALAASASPSTGMAGMAGMAQMMSATGSHAPTGFTNGWLDGHTVRFFYSKNFSCAAPPA